ncbi:MAG: Holliday junction resolvase RuvX [Wenzhouxiangellaceae bacterium]
MPERAATVLGIDYGARRIGLATGNTLTGTARALTTVHHQGDPFAQLDRVLAEWQPDHVVIGLPLAADGGESEISRRVRQFAGQLTERHPGLKLSFEDERFSSQAAESQFAKARGEGRARSRDAGKLDGVAAAIIVESWLAGRAAENRSEPG